MTNNKNETPEQTDAEMIQDDAVIGVFFKYSLGVFALVGIIGAAIYAWQQRGNQNVEQIDNDRAAPVTSIAATEATTPTILFENVSKEIGIDFVHENGAYGDKLLPETMGGGVALFDYDNDGLIDIFLVNSSKWPWSKEVASEQLSSTVGHKLYRNLGGWQFDDVTEAMGLDQPLYGMGVAIGDYNGDGFQDLYLTAVGENRLYQNMQGTGFEVADLGVAGGDNDWSTSAAFFDMDGDGDLDLFVCNYVVWSREIDFEVDYQMAGIGRAYGPPTNYRGMHSKLWRNDGDTFVDVSAASGIEVSNPSTGAALGKALAVKPIDLNNDQRLDLVVANDTVQNFVFMNQGDGRFSEEGTLMGVAFDNMGSATGAMGVDSAHYNNDDDVAVAIANFANEMTSFYVARGSEVFTDESIVSGIGAESRRALSFGLVFFDADLDGRPDLLAANGHVEDDINKVQPSQQHAQPAQLFWNCGPQCRRPFQTLSNDAVGDLSSPIVGRGAAVADLDQDGDLDIVLTQTGGEVAILKNGTRSSDSPNEGPAWIGLRLAQTGRNSAAFGALVSVQTTDAKGQTQTQNQTVMPARSYLSQVPTELRFGLGRAEAVRVSVRWPDGIVINYNELAINQTHELRR